MRVKDRILYSKLKQLCSDGCSMLWLEGPRHDRVLSIRVIHPSTLVLRLANGSSKMIRFVRYNATSVGLQFWDVDGRPGVLFRWEHVPHQSWKEDASQETESEFAEAEEEINSENIA